MESQYDYAIVIPKGLMESAEAGKDVQIEGYGIMESNVSVPVKYMLRSYLSSAIVLGELKADKADYLDMLKEYEEGKVVYEIKDISDKEATIKSNFVLALGISVMCILLLLTFSTTLIIKDKDSGMYERILSGPTGKAKYNAQHILAYFLVALVQVFLLIYLAKALSNMEIGKEIINRPVCSIFAGSSNTGNCNIELYEEYKTGKCNHQFNHNPDVYVGRMLVGSKYDAGRNAENSKCGTDHMGNEGH